MFKRKQHSDSLNQFLIFQIWLNQINWIWLSKCISYLVMQALCVWLKPIWDTFIILRLCVFKKKKKTIDATAPANLFRLAMSLAWNWFCYEPLQRNCWCDYNTQQTSKTRTRSHYVWNMSLLIHAINHCQRQRDRSFQKRRKTPSHVLYHMQHFGHAVCAPHQKPILPGTYST